MTWWRTSWGRGTANRFLAVSPRETDCELVPRPDSSWWEKKRRLCSSIAGRHGALRQWQGGHFPRYKSTNRTKRFWNCQFKVEKVHGASSKCAKLQKSIKGFLFDVKTPNSNFMATPRVKSWDNNSHLSPDRSAGQPDYTTVIVPQEHPRPPP